ncbi:prephenate dehydratase [Loigolactobacillus jiayinensis]|uniref:Prephenate dehydratase n=1 Tax=Loigolactobacillus jiayinensis TaxID=2486016 RepID=A0ABW1RKW6_9LACO|nr:prephenate dehydratase domain-containing protein [Loigolactobacillus jiayinensis]
MVPHLAVLGPAGTFSDDAAQQYLRQHQLDWQLTYYNSIDQVAASIQTGTEYALLPLENTLDGYVQNTLAILSYADLQVVGETLVPVRFSLAAKATSLAEIKRVYVQFKTKGQCEHILAQLPQAERLTTESNMLSFNKLKQATVGDAAIIPQARLAQLPATFLKLADVTDTDENYTRFIVVKKQTAPLVQVQPWTQDFRALCYVTPQTDHAGLLSMILQEFAQRQLNLIAIMSRPTRRELGQYRFFIEIGGRAGQSATLAAAFSQLAQQHQVKYLGSFAQ